MSHGLGTLKESFAEYEAWAKDPTPRVGTGLDFIDGRTSGGIARSEVLMLIACSSVGKTAVALNWIRNNPGLPALFFSLEMSRRMLAARLAAMHTGASTRMLETKYKAGDVPDEVQETIEAFPLLMFDDTPALNLKQMKDSMNKAADAMGEMPRVVVIDYMELISGAGMSTAGEAVDKTARKVRDWTREFDCSTILLHQVGKGDGGPGAEPLNITSGRFGGHQPMDYVIGAYAPRLANGVTNSEFERVKDHLYLQLLKNRAGESQPSGKLHRLDSTCLRLSAWDEQPWADRLPAPHPHDDPAYREVVS
jgi:KaiC/GvpD/RAD55 family RecA-like ATPase